MKFGEQDYTYITRDGEEFAALVYRPESADDTVTPVVIDVHGGAWSSGHRKSGRHYDRALAAAGICVVSIDFRQGPAHKHPAATEDIAAAIDWCLTTEKLDLERSSLGIIGSSSGGHLAMLTSLDAGARPSDSVINKVDYVIALWPVSNPIARLQYVTSRLDEEPDPEARFSPDKLIEGHHAYFESEEQMSDAAIQNVLMKNLQRHLPDLFIVQPELDQNVPVMMSQTLKGAWQLAGGNADYKLYEGVGHAFAHGDGEQSQHCIIDMIEYIHSHDA